MKNIKLSIKIGLGFGALLLIACGLGVMAIFSMDNVSSNANHLSEEFMPQVSIANKIERHTLLLMYAMRGYSMTETQSYWDTSQKELKLAKEYLDQGKKLASAYPELEEFDKNLSQVSGKLRQYEAKMNVTSMLIEENQSLRNIMDSASDSFLHFATNYHEDQLALQEQEIQNQKANYLLRQRASNIKLIYIVVKEAQAIQTNNFKAQVVRDPEIVKEASRNFFVIFRLLKNLEKKTSVAKNKDALKKMEQLCKDFEQSLTSSLSTWENLISLDEEREQLAMQLLNMAEAMAMNGMDSTRATTDQNISKLDSAKLFMLIGLGVALLIGITLSFVITRTITKPVFKTVHFAERIAEGHLDDTLEVSQKDEIGNLANSLRKMVANLKSRINEAHAKSEDAAQAAEKAQSAMLEAEQAHTEAVNKSQAMVEAAGRLQGVAEITTSASEQLSAQVEQSSKGAENQAKRVAETATAMEEMSAIVLEVAKNAAHAADISSSAKAKAQEGAAIVDKVVQGIGEVQNEAQALKSDMVQLSEQAENIGQVMSVISDIADQTNLLALNAAIEAARAGEAGRGFAVVADEVRKLAEKTMSATKEVGDAIGEIQTGTRKNMDNVDRTVDHVTEATTLANQSGQALNDIVLLVEQTSDQVSAIATASEEQSSATEQINRSIEEVNTISSETADAMTQAAQAVTELAGQSHELKRLIEQMQTA